MIVSKTNFPKKLIGKYPFAKEQILREKYRIADEYFEGKCSICWRPSSSGCAYHHLEYDESRKVYKDFDNTFDYNAYLFPEIRANPERFLWLCKVCHHRLDGRGGLSDMPSDQLDRLVDAARRTQPKPKSMRKHPNKP